MAFRSSITFRAEDDVDADALKEIVHAAMTGDHYFHQRMSTVLGEAGFDVSTVHQHPHHQIYEIRMKRGDFDLAKDDRQAARQIRRLLKRAKFYIEPDAINVTQYGERLRLVFIFPFGADGTLRVKR
jgi:hypothetical protein